MRALIWIAALASLSPAWAGSVPRRIVSTAPSITETLFALGLGARVVGDTTFCNYPPAARRLPRIGTFLEPNLETILALRPDLVVIIRNPIHLGEKIRALGLRVVEVDQETVSSIFDSIRQLGAITGVPDAAAKLTRSLKSQLDQVRRRAAAQPRKRVAFIIGRNPGALEGMVAVGNASYLNELLALAGGDNVFGKAAAAYPRVSLEEIFARDPEVIIDMGDMAQPEDVSAQRRRAVVNLWNRYPSISAVKHRRVFAVSSGIFVVPGPRMVEAARAFERFLHSEAAQ